MLGQNYPNPFNPVTSIEYGIKERSEVRISVITALGEEVALLQNSRMEPGYYSVKFNASNLPSGIYLSRMQAGNFISVKKMVLMK